MSSRERIPRISVVVSTYRRSGILTRTLDCLARQDLSPGKFEIIVSDDGSPDETAAVVEQFKRRAPVPVTYLWHHNRGPGYTHNCGIRGASAPIVLLLADDILLEPSALSSHLRIHDERRDPHIAVFGRISQSPDLRTSVFMRRWAPPHCLNGIPDGAALPWTLFWAAHISLNRDFMLAHGLFREAIGVAGPAAHEDVELGARLARQGLRIIYSREAHGLHYHPESLEHAARRAYERGVNFEEFSRLAADDLLVVRYHILTLKTLPAHLRARFGRRRSSTLSGDRSLGMLLRNLARRVAFNRVTVPSFWRPLMNRAEKSRVLASLVRGSFYRGVLQHYFLAGYRAGTRPVGSAAIASAPQPAFEGCTGDSAAAASTIPSLSKAATVHAVGAGHADP